MQKHPLAPMRNPYREDSLIAKLLSLVPDQNKGSALLRKECDTV